MSKLLLFGGGGFIGGNLATIAKRNGWDVYVADRTVKPGLKFAHWKKVNITNPDQVDRIITEIEPLAVINLAAMADIDQVENEPELAWEINAIGPKNVAKSCARTGVRHIYISSDAVFDGAASHYTEVAQTNPVNFYGRSKAEAEKGVLQIYPESVVIRISLVLGFPVTGGNSLFSGLEKNLQSGEEIQAPKEEIRTPIDVITLSECLLELAENECSGLLHIGGTESIDRFSLTRKIVRKMGFDADIVVLPDKRKYYRQRAPRHPNSVLDVSRAKQRLSTKLQSVDESLHRAFTDRIHPLEVSMEKPDIKYELEVAHGSVYGFEETLAVIEVLKNRAPSCGKKVIQFEKEFATYCGTQYALAVTSATTGLTLAGIAAGVGSGTEVITSPISWVSTSMAFSTLGADVVFCDVNPHTLNLDPGGLESLITPKTRAIVPVHLYGQCAEMDLVMEIAKKHGITVIEDSAHNPGGEYLGKKSGSLGDMGVFSFHQQKNMGTLGEGGMITTGDKEIYERALSYRSLCCRIYGESDKYLTIDENKHPMDKEYWKLYFDDFGYNYRMTDAQAAVGIEQLKKLGSHNERRIQLANRLTEKLGGIEGLTLPYIDPKGKHVFHLYMVQLEDEFPLSKKDFMWQLYTEKGIKAWSHYMLIHMSQPYREQGHAEGECPVAEDVFDRYVTLPIHPRLTDGAIDYMADTIREMVDNA